MDHMDQHVSRVLEVDVEEKTGNRRLATPYLTALSGSLNIQGCPRTKQKTQKKPKKKHEYEAAPCVFTKASFIFCLWSIACTSGSVISQYAAPAERWKHNV